MQRQGLKPSVPQSQGPTLVQSLEGRHHHATTAEPTDTPTADRTHAVTDTAGCTPAGPHDPETQSKARTTGDTGALPTQPARLRRDDPSETTGAGPQETTEGEGREGPDSRRAEQLAVMSADAIDKCDTDLIHYDTDDELDLRRLRNVPTGTDWHDTGEETPRDLQQPTPEAHAGEPLATPTRHHAQPWVMAPTATPLQTQALTPGQRRWLSGKGGRRRGGALPTGHPPAGGGDMCPPDNRGHQAHGCWGTKDHAQNRRSPS